MEQLTAQVEEMSQSLEDAKEQRNALLRERFEKKEQRRYFRAQMREARAAGNDARIHEIDGRLDALEEEIQDLDGQIEDLEDTIDITGDQVEDALDALDDMAEDAQETLEEEGQQEDQEWAQKLEHTVDRLNGLLQKGFQKVADKLEHLDLDQVSENVQTAATKAAKTVSEVATDAAKTVSGVATDAAKTVETAWSEAKENRQKPGGIGDCRVSGSSVIDGGCYNRITVSGGCKVSSDLVCRELSTSGSFRACGGVDCNGPVRVSGSFHCAGPLLAGSLSSSGSVKVQEDLRSGTVTSTGGLHVGGDCKGTVIRSSGTLQVEGDLEADSFTSTGGLRVGGMVNADVVNIRLSMMESTAGSIGGSKVHVAQSVTGGLLSGILKPTGGRLTCESIEGDQVELAGVTAQVVRGTNVVIGAGCDIQQVEYTETCTVDSDAKVGSCTKV
jgi:cytoskeletal protein CcmA (bactofilin family)